MSHVVGPTKMSLIRFEEFELDEQTFELRRNGSRVRIQQQPTRLLAFLLSRQGKLVTRQQIQDAIWGQDTFVDFGECRSSGSVRNRRKCRGPRFKTPSRR